MSWAIKHRKKDDKYRLWTTISDGWLTDWLTRDEIIEAIGDYQTKEHNIELEKLQKTFPNGWSDKDNLYRKRHEDSRYMSEADWHKYRYEQLTGRKF